MPRTDIKSPDLYETALGAAKNKEYNQVESLQKQLELATSKICSLETELLNCYRTIYAKHDDY